MNLTPHARGALLLALGLVVQGCPATGGPTARPRTAARSSAPSIASFSETQPFTSVTHLGGRIYAGTPRGVIRFDADTGEFIRLTRKEGLAGDHVYALSASPLTGLWVATDNGISRYHDGVWTNYPAGNPPGATVTAMAATGAGVWAGGPQGLGRLEDGKWTGYLPGAAVTYLLADLSGRGVWVGTAGEGIYHFTGGKLVSHNPARGQLLRTVRSLTRDANGAILAVGSDGERDRLVFFDGRHWTTYTPSPAGRLRWVQQVAGEVLLAHDERILKLRRFVRPPGKRRATAPSGPVEFDGEPGATAPSGYPAPELYTEPLGCWLPPDPTIVVGFGREMLIATRNVGLARFDGSRVRWYRTSDLLGDFAKLRAACGPGACFMAGGGGVAYRYASADKGFEPFEIAPESRAQAFFRAGSGALMALSSNAAGRSLVLWRLAGKRFERVREYPVSLPQEATVEVRFVRLDPRGVPWVGLRRRDRAGDRRGWGVLLLRDDGTSTYHRSTLLPTEDRPAGSLALPDDIRDVTFIGDVVWLASGVGACRVRGARVDLFTENEGLESEIVHSFARGIDGKQVMVGTYRGVGRYDGEHWYFDYSGPLRAAARVLLRRGDSLWIGTEQGVVRWRGRGRHSVEVSAQVGLAAPDVHDLHFDRHGRLWVLTGSGLSILPAP